MRNYVFISSLILAIIVPSILGYVITTRYHGFEELPPPVKSGLVFGRVLILTHAPGYYHVAGSPEWGVVEFEFKPRARDLGFIVERDVWVRIYIVGCNGSDCEIVFRDQHLLATVLKKGLRIRYNVVKPGNYTLYIYVVKGDKILDTFIHNFVAIEPRPIKARIVFDKRVFCINETIKYKIVIDTNEPVIVDNPQGPYELYKWNGEKWMLVKRSTSMGLWVSPGNVAVKTIYYKLSPGKYKVVERITGELTRQTIKVEAEFLVIECS